MACPVCGHADIDVFAHARDLEYFTSDATYRYLRCPACTAVYLENPPADRLDDIYPPNYYSYGEVEKSTAITDRVKAWLDGRALRKLLDVIPGDRLRVLDVGGGTGWSLTSARRVCPRVSETHEVDMAQWAEPLATAAGHVYHCMPIQEYTSDQPFDLILMNSVIEHVPDPRQVLRGVARLLSDRGIVVIKTPNTDTLDCRIFRHRNWGGYHCPRHFVLFTQPGLVGLGRRCGLELVRSVRDQGAPQWAISVMAVLEDRGWIKVTPQRPAYQHPIYEPLTAAFAAIDFARSPFMPTAQMVVTFRRARRTDRTETLGQTTGGTA